MKCLLFKLNVCLLLLVQHFSQSFRIEQILLKFFVSHADMVDRINLSSVLLAVGVVSHTKVNDH